MMQLSPPINSSTDPSDFNETKEEEASAATPLTVVATTPTEKDDKEVNDLKLLGNADLSYSIIRQEEEALPKSKNSNLDEIKPNHSIGESGDEQEKLTRLNLLSYNVFMRPVVKTNKSDYKDARLEELIIKMKDEKFDIICLQELFSTASQRLSRLLSEFSEFHHVHLSRNTWKLKPIDSGLVIMSRFPIIERDSFIFSQGSNIDGYSTKGVISVLLDVSKNSQEKKYLLVFNTHTQANYDLKDESYWKIQQSQVSEMTIFIHRKMEQFKGIPAFVCGDLNIDARNKPEWYDWMMNCLNQINNQQALESLQKQYPLDISQLHGSPISTDYSAIVKELSKRKVKKQSKIEITDLLLQQEGHHPISFGDFTVENGVEKPREVILTNPQTLMTKERLDYIFMIQSSPVEDDASENNTSTNQQEQQPLLSVKNSSIEPFFRSASVITESMPCTQLSDHYAIRLTCSL